MQRKGNALLEHFHELAINQKGTGEAALTSLNLPGKATSLGLQALPLFGACLVQRQWWLCDLGWDCWMQLCESKQWEASLGLPTSIGSPSEPRLMNFISTCAPMTSHFGYDLSHHSGLSWLSKPLTEAGYPHHPSP